MIFNLSEIYFSLARRIRCSIFLIVTTISLAISTRNNVLNARKHNPVYMLRFWWDHHH